MTLRDELSAAGGLLPSRELMERGYTAHTLKRAFSEGRISRPRRGWIGLPNLDPELRYAVEHGVLLSCLSVARRHELWVRGDSGPHFAARNPHARVACPGHSLHWGLPVRIRDPLLMIDSLENALNYIAYCQPHEEALAIWESALNKELVTFESLERYPYVGRAREILDVARPYSDSGLESYVGRRLRAIHLRFVAQAFLHGHRVDFLIEGKLVLQVDGGHHIGPQRDADNLQDAILLINGYPTIRVSYWQVTRRWAGVQKLIMDALSSVAR